jgi:hypothetical protein
MSLRISIEVTSPMTPNRDPASNLDDAIDVALHDQIKCRAYELYERQGDEAETHDKKAELRFELLRVAYSAAQVQKYSDGEVGDSKAVRAARVYLRALTSYIAQA